MGRRHHAQRGGGGLLLAVAVVAAAVISGGCTGYRGASEKFMRLYSAGQVEQAAAMVCSPKFKQDKRDQLIWLLEKGKALHDVGRFRESNEAFAQADELLAQFDGAAKVSLSQETGAALADQTVRDYQGTAADRIFVSTYQSLNYLAQGEFEEARVHARRAHDRQAEALDLNAKALAKARERFEHDWTTKYKATTQPSLPLAAQEEALKPWLTPAYASFANPLASYLSALLSLGDGDVSNAEVDLRKCIGMVPENRFLRDEWNAMYQPPDDQFVYVLFENGLAPSLAEEKYAYATPWTGLSMVGLPKIAFSPCAAGALAVSGSGVSCRTQPLASVNSIVATDFNGRFGTVVFRTVTSLLVKEAATAAAVQAARQADAERARRNGKANDRMGEAMMLIGGSIWKAAASNADLRTWRTLPAEVQLARFPRPRDGVVNLSLVTPGGAAAGPSTSVYVPDTRVTLLLVRSVCSSHLSCRVAPLTPVENAGGAVVAAAAATSDNNNPNAGR